MTPRALLSVLYNASKGIDVVTAAHDLGIDAMLDAGPVSLRRICEATGTKPNRMYKLLDCLESMGLVARSQRSEERLDAQYQSTAPLVPAFEAVLGPSSIERDRDRYDWRSIHGRLPAVLRGEFAIESFAWPPQTPEQVAGFEASMAAGCTPIVESFRRAREKVFDGAARWLDVGGGDGTLALALLSELPQLSVDILNLPQTRELVLARARAAGVQTRMGFVGMDFFADELPSGYDVVSFVRVLHDWDESRARALLTKGARAVAPGGHIVVCEEFRTPERLAVQFFWTYFLMGVDACESRLREVEFYTRVLEELGFEDVRVLHGPFDLVIARKP
ncbi:Hydroxyneurosporene methyltransferase [Labilithrix luteola]|uniref:Hydroxyneurosporene methyltransferase n=1 Tax=Labilithrix luteola TaxID=1391654 RepID=A0A0K1Q012_9BACT|nr:methyltransferase [Labilithrix luteola]AKU99087.1 Hydroxyneurosporene methyltransferase [Labilithrix luteola]